MLGWGTTLIEDGARGVCETGRVLTLYRGFDSWSRTTELGRLELWRWAVSALVAGTLMQLEVWNVSLEEYVIYLKWIEG